MDRTVGTNTMEWRLIRCVLCVVCCVLCGGGGISVHDEDPIIALACHPSQLLMLSGDEGGTAKLTNLNNGKVVATLNGHKDSIEAVDFAHGTNAWCATGSLDCKIRVWDTTTAQCRTTMAHDDKVVDLMWHTNQPLLYSCSMDGTVRLWDGRSGKNVRKWHGHTKGVLSIAVAK